MNFFMMEKQKTLKILNTDENNGLSTEYIKENALKYGVNSFTKEKPKSLIKRIFETLCEPMIIILLLAAIITIIVNVAHVIAGEEPDLFECIGIIVAISLAVVITVVMEGRSAKAFEAINKINDDTFVKVVRNGTISLIPQKEIVVGDIVFIETGDKLTADGRLIESASLYADESSLTGESVAVQKNENVVYENEKTPIAERENMLYSGCFITSGSGKMVITAVGDKTEFGKIAGELSSTIVSSTPLQEKIKKMGKMIAIFGGSTAAIVFFTHLVVYIINGTVDFYTISGAFINSIVLIVASVPEGLPTIVAVSLAINIIKMSKQNALVKKLIACETVGCINIICSDKTGTLTENRMTVTSVYTGGKIIDSQNLDSQKLDNKFMFTNFCINSTADVEYKDGHPKFIGNPTECALLITADKAGLEYKQQRAQAKIVHVFPFSSENKDMTTIIEENGVFTAYTKGSPEKILSNCNITAEEKSLIEKEIMNFQEKACRVIGFSHKTFDVMPELSENEIKSQMTFDGFTAITDPLRSDVLDAVEKSRSAGIGLIMMTGDNIVTATAIANELGILDENKIAVEANELEELTEQELSDKLADIRVIARSTPSIKMKVVNTLKADGNVVAVTGDGINDAPAIKNADVGIAMGITGTEVSKEASDIVLLDDSFSTIIKAVQWGRGIYENFQRFIQFQLTVNVSFVITILFSILVSVIAGLGEIETPFTALEILWINIIMDGPPALTLGLEPIRGDLMKRQPTKRNTNIISKQMFIRIAINGVFISAVFLSQRAWNFMGVPAEQSHTVLFTLFVIFQLFNAFNSRELGNTSIFKNMIQNKMMLVVFALTFLLQFVITQFGGMFFDTVPLSFEVWLKIIWVGISVIVFFEIIKLTVKIANKFTKVL